MTRSILRRDDRIISRISEIGRLYKGGPKGSSQRWQGGDDYNNEYLRFEPADRLKTEHATEHGFDNLFDQLKARWESLIASGSVKIRLAGATIEECFPWENKVVKKWGKMERTVTACDGQTCSLWVEDAIVNGKKQPQIKRGSKPCAAVDDRVCPLGCSPKAMLKMMIPDLYPGGLVIFPIGSTIDIASILGGIEPFKVHDLRGIPFSLFRKAQTVSWTDGKGNEQIKINWGLNIEVDPRVASGIMDAHARRFERLMENDFMEAAIVETRSLPSAQRRSLPPSAPKFSGSDDEMNFKSEIQRSIREASLDILESALDEVRELVDGGFYGRDCLGFVAREESRAREAIQSVMPAPIVPKKSQTKQAELSPARQRINFFRQKTEIPVADLAMMATRLELPPSAEMTEDDAIVLVGEMLSAWAMDQSEKISPEVAQLLVSRSIEATTTDEALWADFEMRVEAHIADNQ